MLGTDAERIAAEIEERVNARAGAGPQIKATVRKEASSPQSVPAGAGRPTFIRYFIHLDDGTRRATLGLGQAAALLDDVEPDWGPDRLFDAIRGLDVPVEDVN
ncbi:MAG: hypothetical protein ABR608_09535 [Pseudonocardiaceae bacterium]